MKKRSLIILLVAVLVGLVVIGAGTTYAWLTQEDENVITYEVGEINYGITLEGQVPNLVVPGQPLTPTFTITNNSNIDTNLRALVSIKSYKDSENNDLNWTIGTSDEDHIKFELGSVQDGKDWVINAADVNDKYLYFGAADMDNTSTEDTIDAGNNAITNLFNSLTINGLKVGNEAMGATVVISVKFEVKQADYVTWTEMGTIDFSTGLPKVNQQG